MSPVATKLDEDVPATLQSQKQPVIGSLGPTLVIGSPATAQDGTYPGLISELQKDSANASEVEKQMIDRILDGATSLTKDKFSSVHITLSVSDYETFGSRLDSLASQILDGLLPLGKLHLLNTPLGSTLPDELSSLGFTILTTTPSSTIVAQKPARSYSLETKTSITTANNSRAGGIAMPLPRRGKGSSQKKSTKEALWTLVSPSTPSIDAEALLTPDDRVRPPECNPGSSSTPRRKKACKGCTCGLAEIEMVEEAEQVELSEKLKVVLLDADGAVEVDATNGIDKEKERLKKAAESATKATSSCGSCYLGDAFRCSSCPYKGLPAFTPGEIVQIDFGDDDL